MSESKKSFTIQLGPKLDSLLFITFLVLKLTNTITWSWWWVTAPLWLPIVLGLSILILFFLIKIIVTTFSE